MLPIIESELEAATKAMRSCQMLAYHSGMLWSHVVTNEQTLEEEKGNVGLLTRALQD